MSHQPSDQPVDPKPPASISASLLERVRCGDEDGWRRLAYLYEPVVQGWARRAGLRGQDAEDVTQDVFRSAFGAIGGFRREGPEDTFRGWLWTITRNKINDHFRAAANTPHAAGGTAAMLRMADVPSDVDLPSDVDESASLADGSSALGEVYRRALELVRAEFNAQHWQAFWRVTVDQHPAADVARELGMSRGAVYVVKSRVLGRLRHELEGLEQVAE